MKVINKICPSCMENKSIDNFAERKKGVGKYRQSWCKKCIKNASTIWRKSNKKLVNSKSKLYYRKNIEENRKKSRDRYVANREKIIINRKKLKKDAVDKLGGSCSCCGENEIAFLTIDHINNDGSERRKYDSSESGDSLYRKIINNKLDYLQVLCFNCNIAKYQNGGICPHVS